MSLSYRDRVKCTTTTIGTGSYTFGAAVSGFQTFGTLSDGSTCFYTVENGIDFEVNKGTKSGTTITRDMFLSSSTGSAISWSAGTKNIYLTPPARAFNDAATLHIYTEEDMPAAVTLSGFTLPVHIPAINTVWVLHDYVSTIYPIHWGNLLLTTPEEGDEWVYGINYTGASDAAFVGDTSQTYRDGYIYNCYLGFTSATGKLFKQSASGVTSLTLDNCYRDTSANPTVSPAALKDVKMYVHGGGDNANAYWVFTESAAGNCKLSIDNYNSKDFEPYFSTYTPYFDLTGTTTTIVKAVNNRFNVADAKYILKATNDATFSPQSLAEGNYLDTASNASGGFETGVDYTSKSLLHIANRNISNVNPSATLSWQANATATTNSGSGTYVKTAGTTTLTTVSALWDNNGGTNNSIRWLGRSGTPVTLKFSDGTFARSSGSAYTDLRLGISINAATPTKTAKTPVFNTLAAVCGVTIQTTLTTNDIIDLRGAGTVDWVCGDGFLTVEAHI